MTVTKRELEQRYGKRMNSYEAFILYGLPHSWRVKAWAPLIFVRAYLVVWHRPRRSLRWTHDAALSNAVARWRLAWSARPTCGQPFRRPDGSIIDWSAR